MFRSLTWQRILRSGLYAAAGLALLSLLAAAWVNLSAPDLGLAYSPYTGWVTAVDPNGPAAGKLLSGARLYYLEGEPVSGFRVPLTWQKGSVVRLVYADGRGLEQTRIELAAPSLRAILDRLVPLLAGLVWVISGVAVLARSGFGRLPLLYALACQTGALAGGLASLGRYEIAYVSAAFQVLAWWVAPLFLTVFVLLLYPNLTQRRRASLPLFLAALALSIANGLSLGPFSGRPEPPLALNLWTAVQALAAAGLALARYLRQPAVEQRRSAGLLVLAAWCGALPIALLSLLPEAFTGKPLVGYPITVLALPLLPLGLGYAIHRSRLVYWESTIHRSAAFALAALVVAALYLTIFLSLPGLLPGKDVQVSALALLAAVGLIFAAHPLVTLLRKGLAGLFYGGWYDERAAVKQISQAIGRSEGDVRGVAETLCQALVRTLQISYAHLLLPDGRLIVQERARPLPACRSIPGQAAQRLQTFFADSNDGGKLVFSEREIDLPLPGEQRRQILGSRPQMELLLAGRSGHLGLLVLGPRLGAEFEPRDLEILEVVVRQAKTALENARLLEEVRQRSEHVNRLHRQLLAAREEERKRVARDLHDQTVQALVGLNYQISSVKKHKDPVLWQELNALQGEVLRILAEVRQLCSDLRPPGLDAMGLAPAIRSRLAVLHAQPGLQVEFSADDDFELSEAGSLCLYRVFQEALVNVQKHAQADHVSIYLKHEADWAVLVVEDDGRGFTLPAKLEEFSQKKHFGLVGLKEQLEAAGGSLEIVSAPDRGCRLAARLPLQETPREELV